mgnify:CR=1 FL=1
MPVILGRELILGREDDMTTLENASLGHHPAAGSRPDPRMVTNAAEFVTALRRLKDWSGASYRELEKRAAKLGAALPRSTVVAALNRPTLPREGLLVAYLRACGCDEAEVAGWLDTRQRLACGELTAGPDAVTAGPRPRRRRSAWSWPLALLLMVGTVVFLLVGEAAARSSCG